jgi:hypothetical protein
LQILLASSCKCALYIAVALHPLSRGGAANGVATFAQMMRLMMMGKSHRSPFSFQSFCDIFVYGVSVGVFEKIIEYDPRIWVKLEQNHGL